MDIRYLGRIDLNLLVAFQALLEERNVSRAAERLFITQSAMSKTLNRLRVLFDDPLFTRTGHGIVPTPRAEALQSQLYDALAVVQDLVADEDFDPAQYQGKFTFDMPDFVGLLTLPELMPLLQLEAPGIQLKTVRSAEHQLEQLASGEIDALVHVEQYRYDPEYDVITLDRAPSVLVTRVGHPLQDGDFTWDEVHQYPILRLYFPNFEASTFAHQNPEVTARLSALEPTLEIADVFTAWQVLQRSDFVMASPPMFSLQDRLVEGLTTLPTPEANPLTLPYVMVTHERVRTSRPHQYLFAKFQEIVERHRIA